MLHNLSTPEKIIWYMRRVQTPVSIGELEQFFTEEKEMSSRLSFLVKRGLIIQYFDMYKLSNVFFQNQNKDFISIRKYKRIERKNLVSDKVCRIFDQSEISSSSFFQWANRFENTIEVTN